MSTVLVCGATGSVGSQVVHDLRARSKHVRAFVRDPVQATARLGDGVELAVGDFSDPASVRRAFQGVSDVFVSCSNQPNQVEHETAVIDAAAAAGVRRIVKLSAVGAEVGSRLAFWDSHGRIEERLRATGVPAVILRANFYMSNMLAVAEQVRHMGQFFAPASGARIAMIDPLDVASAAAVLLAADDWDASGTYVLTGPAALTYDDVARELSEVAGRPVQFVDVPDEAARQSMIGLGMPEWFVDRLIVLFSLLREGALEQTTASIRELTGREPRSFADFARAHASMFRPQS